MDIFHRFDCSGRKSSSPHYQIVIWICSDGVFGGNAACVVADKVFEISFVLDLRGMKMLKINEHRAKMEKK